MCSHYLYIKYKQTRGGVVVFGQLDSWSLKYKSGQHKAMLSILLGGGMQIQIFELNLTLSQKCKFQIPLV